MKKIFKAICLLLSLSVLGGCFKRDNMEDINIYTTVYPIEYIVNTLYKDYSNVKSIYPSGIDVYNYDLTEKQITDYSKASLFVYNGLSDEKKTARKLINQNKNMKIIDVSYGLNIEYDDTPEELWLSPNNFLMLATTVKNNLSDFIKSKYIKEDINTKYSKLQEDVSIIDANLRSIGSAAKNKDQETIITTSNTLKFLENYGFRVISLEDEENYTTELKNNFKNKKYKFLFIEQKQNNEIIQEIIKDYTPTVFEVNMMTVLNEEERKNDETYTSIMNKFLNNLSDATLN